jgi:hypothetical protein
MAAAFGPSRDRPNKILITMFELSNGSTEALKYEDIVVKAFQLFPKEFALRGYPHFPDSSDVHKPLYARLKSGGFVRGAGKQFALTPRGVEEARALVVESGPQKASPENAGARRLTRDKAVEVDRMMGTDAVRLFAEGKALKILDTDFYAFVGCTVRADKKTFIGRMATISSAIDGAASLSWPDTARASLLQNVWKHLKTQFSVLISKREA